MLSDRNWEVTKTAVWIFLFLALALWIQPGGVFGAPPLPAPTYIYPGGQGGAPTVVIPPSGPPIYVWPGQGGGPAVMMPSAPVYTPSPTPSTSYYPYQGAATDPYGVGSAYRDTTLSDSEQAFGMGPAW